MNRYSSSGLQHRDPRSSSSLFDGYPSGDQRSRPGSQSPARGYGLSSGSPYAGASMNGHLAPGGPSYRPATPNSRGQYSDAVLSSLESQNDLDNTSILTSKVRQLKELTVAIGDEIRDSSALADKMNDSFENTRIKLKGTMNRMLRMAERTGVGWKVWVGFFIFVWMLFAWVWLF